MNRLKGIARLPLLVFSLSFLLGIVFASLLTLKTWIWLLFACLTLLLGWGLPGIFRWATVHADGFVRTFLTHLPARIMQPLSKSLIEPSLYTRLMLIILLGLFFGATRYQAANWSLPLPMLPSTATRQGRSSWLGWSSGRQMCVRAMSRCWWMLRRSRLMARRFP